MDIGLCMTVRNEENRIEACLAEIADLFSEIIIIDTGSTDSTIDVLADRFGITALHGKLSEERCFTLADLRNEGFSKLSTPWIMCLDADERIPREGMERIAGWDNGEDTAGFISPWLTTTPDGRIVEDYKLSLFKKGFSKRGLVHDNVQSSLREVAASAEWTDAFEILHYPESAKQPGKETYYRSRLNSAIAKEPDWIRYYWFRGYQSMRTHQSGQARPDFEKAFASRSDFFPVECLNAAMGLVHLHAADRNREAALTVATQALLFHESHKDDFDVVVNFRLKPWLERALGAIEDGDLERVVAYDFAY